MSGGSQCYDVEKFYIYVFILSRVRTCIRCYKIGSIIWTSLQWIWQTHSKVTGPYFSRSVVLFDFLCKWYSYVTRIRFVPFNYKVIFAPVFLIDVSCLNVFGWVLLQLHLLVVAFGSKHHSKFVQNSYYFGYYAVQSSWILESYGGILGSITWKVANKLENKWIFLLSQHYGV